MTRHPLDRPAWNALTTRQRDLAVGDDLARRTGLPVHWIDERLTSVAAERAVRGMGLKRGEREQKERIDAAAAALILDAFLRQRARETSG